MKRFLQLGNILSLIFALVLNLLVGAQLLNLPPINEISDKYATPLTPASYAFAIWSIIYIFLIVFTVYQARDVLKPNTDNDLPLKVGPFFIIASICNGLWTYVFVSGYIGLSVIVLLALTASLYAMMWRLNIATFDATKTTIVAVWWPILFYTGWVTVATVEDVASWVKSMGTNVSSGAASIVLLVLMAVLLVLLVKRNVRELLLASTWGIVAIGVQQMGTAGGETVAITAYGVSGILFVAVAVHGYKNRKLNPFYNK